MPFAHGGVHHGGQKVLQQVMGRGGLWLAFHAGRQAGSGRWRHGSQQLGQPAGVFGPVKDRTPAGMEGLSVHLLDRRYVALASQQLQGKAGRRAPEHQIISKGQRRRQHLWRGQSGQQGQGIRRAQGQALQLEATQSRGRCISQLIPVMHQARRGEGQVASSGQQ